jgi:hypothetical protein
MYTSEAVEFFELVLTSGLIAVSALTVASLIGFTLAHLVIRERAAARQPAVAQAAAPAVAVRSRAPAATAYAASTPAAVAG